MNPDGTIGLTVDGTRFTLRQITLGEMRRLRDLYNEIQGEVTDHLEFDARPALQKAREALKDSDTKAARAKARKALNDQQKAQDSFVQAAWARWWREAINTLSPKKLPDPSDDPAEGLEPWMVDSPASIAPMFRQWRAVPLAESSAGAEDLVRAIASLQDG